MVITRPAACGRSACSSTATAGNFELVVTEYRLRDIPGFSDCLDRRYYAWKDLGPYQVFRPLVRTPETEARQLPLIVIFLTRRVGQAIEPRHSRSFPTASTSSSICLRFPRS